MGADKTAVTAAMKEAVAKTASKVLFDDEQLTPFLGIIEKKSGNYDAFGRKFVQPIQYGDGESFGYDFATSQAKAQGSTVGSSNLYTRWEVTEATLEGFAYWSRNVINSIVSDTALFDFAKNEIDSRMRAMRNDFAREVWGDGLGSLAIIKTVPSATTMTVAKDRINRFRIGQDLVGSLTNVSGDSLRSTTSVRVTQIDPDTNTVTLSASISALGWVAGDSVYRKADQPAATLGTNKLLGAGAWVPNAAPGATLYCNVNRQGSWELGGLRKNCTGMAIKTAILQASADMWRMGATKVSHCLMSTVDFAVLKDTLDNIKHIDIKAREYNISFKGISLDGDAGPIEILSDPWAPAGEFLMGDFKSEGNIYLVHPESLVNIDDHDGNMFLRAASSANYETRLYSVCNLVVGAPGKFMKGYNVGL